MSKGNSSPTGNAVWRRRCLAVATALMLAGCAAQNAYRESQTLLAEGKFDAGLAKIQEAMALDPASLEYRLAYGRVVDGEVVANLAKADRALGQARYEEAEAAYRRVLALRPDNEAARSGLRLVDSARRQELLYKEAELAWGRKDVEGALARLRAILAANATNERALALQRVIEENAARATKESVLAAAYRRLITIEFRDTPLKTVFEVISRTSGLNFVFDKDVRADQRTTIFLRNSTIESAINMLLLTNQLEQRVLDGNSILIYPNTPAKQKEYQALVVKTYYLANTDAKTVGTTLKTILKTRDIVVDEKLNLLMIRDSPEAVRLADKMVALQDIPEPEVMLEVEIIEVTRERIQALGINWPDSMALRPLPVDTLTLNNLLNLNTSSIGVTVGPTLIRANQLDTDANLLANPRIRARNREKAKVLIGDRVPNITSTITATGFASESITYIDVGLKLDIEPTIYVDNEVAIKVTLEVSNIVNTVTTKSGTQAYQIGTRTATSVMRLKNGEGAVLAGLIQDEDRREANKVPFLGEVPILGRLFGSHRDDGKKTEIVMSITPRIIRNIQRAELYLSEFDGGTETSFRRRPDGGGLSQMSGTPSGPATAMLPPGSPTAPTGLGNPTTLPVQSGLGSPGAGAPAQPAMGLFPQAYPSAPMADGSVPQAAASPAFAAPPAGSPPMAAAGGGSAQMLWQGPTQTKVGDTFAVQLVMQAEQPVVSVPIAIGFDPRLLQVVDVSEGGFLRQGGAQTSFSYRVDPGGQVVMTATSSGNAGATAPDAIVTMNFRALAAGAARVELITAAPVGNGGSTVSAVLPGPHAVAITP